METPDPEDSWAQVELYRWQYGELPTEGNCKPLIPSEGMLKATEALEKGIKNKATVYDPSAHNYISMVKYCAKLLKQNNQ